MISRVDVSTFRRLRRRTRAGRRSPGSERSRPWDAPRACGRAPGRSRSGAGREPRASSARAAAATPGRAQRRSRAASKLAQPLAVSGSRHTTAPRSTSEWPLRYFVALWRTRSAPCSSGRRWIGRRGGCVDEHRRRVGRGGLEVGHRQERVRRCLEPDELDAVGRRAGLVELHVLEAPALELAEEASASRSSSLRRPRSWRRARGEPGRPRSSRRHPRRRGAPRRRRARRGRARRRRRWGARSAGSRTRPARRPRTARTSSGRGAGVPRGDCS